MFTRTLAVGLCAAALAAGLAACGSSGDSKSSSSSTSGASSSSSSASKPTGQPIKVMTIAPVHSTTGGTFENIAVTAQTYEKYINDKGGISGRPVKVEVCDDQNDPNKSAFCAQQAVQHGDVAVVGSGTVNGDRIVPILQKARVAWFGNLALTPTELTSPVSFPTGSPITTGMGTAVLTAKNCKTPAYVTIQGGGSALQNLHKAAYGAFGKTWAKQVAVAYTAPDYSPQVAQATQGTDCLDLGLTESNLQRWIPPFQQAGAKQRLIGMQGNLDDKVCKGFQNSCKDALSVGLFPALSSSVWNDFRASLKNFDAPTNLEYNSLGALNAWAAYTIFKNIVSGMTGPITAKTFLDAASSTKKVNSEGMTPPLDFTKEWDMKGMNRIFTRSVVVDQYKDGEFRPYISRYVDLTPVFQGKPPAGL
jgi:ABC-type branched-subunit amino acid transport system substrate-binding protein